MRRPLLLIAGVSGLVACALTGEAGDEAPARRWIWSGPGEEHQEVWFRRAFEVEGPIEFARLWGTCDDAMRVYLNGKSVCESDDWDRPLLVDVAGELRDGTNLLAVWGRNDAGPAGLVLELELGDARGPSRLLSSASWRVTTEDPGPDWTLLESDADWSRATDLGAYGEEPWGLLGDGEPPAPRHALAADEISVPAGFEVELVHSVPRMEQGSWISLCADDRGRLYASDQYGGLFRVTLGDPPRIEEVPIALGGAHGLLWAFDALYAVVGEDDAFETGLHRARDTDADDVLDTVEELARFAGSGEHGPHAVVLGPDGDSLFIVAGNHTELPDVATSRVPRVWDEDQLLPRIEDPNGHAVGKRAPGGWIVETDPDGEAFELVAIGFRNPYDIAFDANGELFTFDADMEWDVGLPWYRPTRILHVTSGAEFGWRSGSGKWPESYPDSLPAVVELGPTSPTGILMGRETSFPAAWRSVLFASDWAYGTIHAVRMESAGASFTGTSEPFLSGTPLPVTDLAPGADGALYFTTGGRRAQSGLYRVRWVGPADGEVLEASAPTAEQELRRALEASAGSTNAVQAAWPALSSGDRHVRFAARTQLELTDPAGWRARALIEEDPTASIEALLALVRTDPTLTAGEVASRIDAWPWDTFERDDLLAALRVLALALLRVDGLANRASALDARLLASFPSGDGDVDRELARLFAAREVEAALPALLDLLDSAPTQEDAIHYALVLSAMHRGWDDAKRARFLAWFDTRTTDFEGGVSFRQYLGEIRRRGTESMGLSLTDEAPVVANALATLPGEPPLRFVQKHTLESLEPALERLDYGRDFERGKHFYRRTSCLQCHRIAGDGGGTGPDLTGLAGRYGSRDLLDSLLDPSATVSDQYRDTEVWTLDGGVVVGRVVEDTADRIVVREASGERVEVAVADVELRREHPLSRMPEGLLDVLTEDDVLDLMAYVLAGGDASAPAFARR